MKNIFILYIFYIYFISLIHAKAKSNVAIPRSKEGKKVKGFSQGVFGKLFRGELKLLSLYISQPSFSI